MRMISIVKASQSYSGGRPPFDGFRSAWSPSTLPEAGWSRNSVSNRNLGRWFFLAANMRSSSRLTSELE